MRFGRSALVCLAGCLLLVLFAPARAAANVCISVAAKERLDACPDGVKPRSVKKRERASLRSAAPKQKSRPKTGGGHHVPDDDVDDAVGRRQKKLGRRSKALLVREIQGLEGLLDRTDKKAPDRARIVLRIANGYAELAAVEQRTQTKAEVALSKAKRRKAARAERTRLRKRASLAKRTARSARQRAIGYYSRFAKRYRNHPRIDRVLYNLAYEHELSGQPKKARKAYFRLIKLAPQSSYVPMAYFAFGELFFVEAQGDPASWELARDAYREVTKYPPGKNRVYGLARYKLAYVHWNRGELKEALNELKKVIEYGRKHAGLPGAKHLARAARRDLVPLYAEAGRADRAFRWFFSPLSGDAPGQSTKAIAMLGELGLAYLDTGHYRSAITLFRELLRRDAGERACHYQVQITEAVAALESGNKTAVRRELGRLLDLQKRFVTASHGSKAKQRCTGRTAEMLTETAMAWHLEAVGSGDVRGTGDLKTMAHASALYAQVTSSFSPKTYRHAKFARVIAEDRPTLCSVRYASADLLYEQKRWPECGAAFDAVVTGCASDRVAPAAAFAAAECYKKAHDRAHASVVRSQDVIAGQQPDGAGSRSQSFDKKPLSAEAKRMIAAFDRYVCFVKPDPKDRAAVEQLVEIKYARARTYFEARHWEEAAVGFRDVAVSHAKDSDAGVYAAHLYLEAKNVLASKLGRVGCIDEMAADLPKLSGAYCGGELDDERAELCGIFGRIECDLGHTKAQKLVALADDGAGNARKLYEKAARQYRKLWMEHGKPQIERGEEPACERMATFRYNEAKAHQAAHYLAKAIQVRRELIDPKWGLHESAEAQKAVYELAQNYQAIAVYDEAARFFEKYARDTKYRGEHAPTAMSDAVVLHLGLGQVDHAMRVAKSFRRHFGARQGAHASQIAFAIAAHHAEKGQWKQVRAGLTGAARLIDKSATLDVRLQAHALLGRALTKLGRARNADAEYAKVRKLWADPKAGERAIRSAPRKRGQEAAPSRPGAHGRGRSDLLCRRKEAAPRREREASRVQGPGDESGGARAHSGPGEAVGAQEAAAHRRGVGRVREDRPAPAGAAARVGHPRRIAGRRAVGRLRRRLPRRAGARLHPQRRRAPRDLRARDRRGVRAAAPESEGRLPHVPRLLGEVSVLRRLEPPLRAVALRQLQGRVPPRRRVPRRAQPRQHRARRARAPRRHRRRPLSMRGGDRAERAMAARAQGTFGAPGVGVLVRRQSAAALSVSLPLGSRTIDAVAEELSFSLAGEPSTRL